jgi:hypothetical protein
VEKLRYCPDGLSHLANVLSPGAGLDGPGCRVDLAKLRGKRVACRGLWGSREDLRDFLTQGRAIHPEGAAAEAMVGGAYGSDH